MSTDNYAKKVVKSLEEYSPKRYSLLLVVPIIFLIIGFFIWNIYLFSFGFLEGEILRAKFILTGLVFSIFTLYASLVYKFTAGALNFLKKTFLAQVRFVVRFSSSFFPLSPFLNREIKLNFLMSITYWSIVGFLTTWWFIIYVAYIFPIIPGSLGGGRPRALSLFADSEKMRMLNSIQVKVGDGADFQTENVCVVHENSQSIF